MKKYAFRLETVRRVRRTQEDLAKADLVRANNEVAAAIAAVEARIATYEQRTTAAQFGSVGVDMFMKDRYFNELSGNAVIAARASLAAAQTEVAVKKEMWADTAKKLKALDRLDARRREEYDIEYARELERETDDIITGRFGRSAATASGGRSADAGIRGRSAATAIDGRSADDRQEAV